MSALSIGDRITRWAEGEAAVVLLVLIGSRTRSSDHVYAADAHSDWDFQIGTMKPDIFRTPAWLGPLGLKPLAYVERFGRLGATRKVTAVFTEGEVDWVILPITDYRAMIPPSVASLEEAPLETQSVITQLATVLKGGYCVLKGAAEFGEFYQFVATQVAPARLSDDAVCALAEGFVCDYVSTVRKINRGELLAAQRWLHRYLVEANYGLLHEQRLRGGVPSLPDARRLEIAGEPRLAEFSFKADVTRPALMQAAEGAAALCRDLMRELVGDRWQWPDLSALRLRRE